jgi:hypothetical protein
VTNFVPAPGTFFGVRGRENAQKATEYTVTPSKYPAVAARLNRPMPSAAVSLLMVALDM